MVAALFALGRRRRMRRVALQPVADHVMIELLGPQQPRERLAHYRTTVDRHLQRRYSGVEIGGIVNALLQHPGEGLTERFVHGSIGQAQLDECRLAPFQFQYIIGGGLGANTLRVHGFPVAVYDVLADPVLRIRRGARATPQTPAVALVFGEEQVGRWRDSQIARGLENSRLPGSAARFAQIQPPLSVSRLIEFDHSRLGAFPQFRLRPAVSPRPQVPEPDRWQHTQSGRLGTAVDHPDPDQNVLWCGLGVLHRHIEVTVLAEDPSVAQFILGIVAAALSILRQQLFVGELGLRVLVQALHVGMRRRVVEVEIVFLDVFAVVALVSSETEKPLLQDGIAAVPKRDGEANALVAVADTEQPIFVPAVGARTCLIV